MSINKKNNLFIIAIAVIALYSFSIQANQDDEHLIGPEFSDHTFVVTMPEEWKKKGITREKWAKGSDLAITLDQHLYPALLPLIQEYGRRHNINIAVQEGTCGISAGNLKEKNADVGGFCCPAGDADRLPGLEFHTLAIAPIAVIVNPENPLQALDEGTVRKIFKGEIVSWKQVVPEYQGSERASLIRAVGRLHCKARPGHWRLILGEEDQFSHRMRDVSTIPDMIMGVAETRGAIGYETLWMTENFGKQNKVKVVKINGIDPSDENAVVKGAYPFYRVYNITTWNSAETRNEQAKELVAYIMDNFDKVDARYGLIPFDRLKREGWQFFNDELVGRPK